mmetsp:Transcript_8969/g.14903  ORF Transcript_8969/g.14903 Transcript_8969/m.14903 type:complete len:587 (+) Transcript_8969:76-1836(+)
MLFSRCCMCYAGELKTGNNPVVQQTVASSRGYGTADNGCPYTEGCYSSCSSACCNGHRRQMIVPAGPFEETKPPAETALPEPRRYFGNEEWPLKVEDPPAISEGIWLDANENMRKQITEQHEAIEKSRAPLPSTSASSEANEIHEAHLTRLTIASHRSRAEIRSPATPPETTPEVSLAPQIDTCVPPASLRSSLASSAGSFASGPSAPSPAMQLCSLAVDFNKILDSAGLISASSEKVTFFGSTRWGQGPSLQGARRASGTSTTYEESAPFIEPEFKDKFLEHSGVSSGHRLNAQLRKLRVGISCKKARKPEYPNQDNIFYCCAGGITICGIADGHGESGHWASHWVARFAIRLMLLEIAEQGSEATRRPCYMSEAVLMKVFNIAHEALKLRAEIDGFDVNMSGSTLSICVVDHKQREVLAAWVGDSRCVVSVGGNHSSSMQGGPGRVRDLTKDHKPQDIEERRRIYERGGEVADGRVWQRGKDFPGLAMSRSIGDLFAHTAGVNHQPGLYRLPAAEDPAPRLLLCCSDGIWEFMNGAEAVEIIERFTPEDVAEGAEALAKQAWETWLREEKGKFTDDISVLALWF